MAISTLRKLLALIEESPGTLSITSLSRELEVSPGRVEDMLEFWIRKGRIKAKSNLAECGNCSAQGDCPFLLEMPNTYELVKGQAHLEDPLFVCAKK